MKPRRTGVTALRINFNETGQRAPCASGDCGGRVVILLYCPSCFLMETGLYWYLRQISLFADVNRALRLFLSVDRLCPGPG